jgi:hypothetical protein
MANYYATSRSNYFAVKDETAFHQWAATLDLRILLPAHSDKTADGIRRFAITPDDRDDGGWPSSQLNPETDQYEDIDLTRQLSVHLADEEVAVLFEVGSEKLRYLTGHAVEVNNKGKTRCLYLADIYKSARKLGTNVTRAEY